jgi:hypothetical protein
MKNMKFLSSPCAGSERRFSPALWLLLLVTTLLQACVSTTPELDARWGVALTEAKAAQSLPPTVPDASNTQPGAGRTSATESLRGLEIHHKGLPAPAAIQAR